jgi:hypothetical protein
VKEVRFWSLGAFLFWSFKIDRLHEIKTESLGYTFVNEKENIL